MERVQRRSAEQRALANNSEARPRLWSRGGTAHRDAVGLPKAKARSMILTQCPVCAASLPDLTAKQCSRCKTRYCCAACQKKHWEEGGHDKLCKKIKKAGGAEQYNANHKYTAAVAVAAEACAEDTKGQTCYICTETVHRHTKEGLVRGCACHTTEGFVHVSCLVERAKILVAEAEEKKLGSKVLNERWNRWNTCGLCKQRYHGVVYCALGWACWKTYLGRQETDQVRCMALNVLGLCLHHAKHYEDALSVREAELSAMRRLGDIVGNMLAVQANLAMTYNALGRDEEALSMERDVYAGSLKLNGEEHTDTLKVANNYASTLVTLERFEEAKSVLRKTLPVARRGLGGNYELTLRMRWNYAKALYRDDRATLDNLREAVTTLVESERTARRVFGSAHPLTEGIERDLQTSRATLRAREAPSGK